ncbi:peptide chain release factor N(5)-glutamine methyltransferase [Brumimicrobium salinarum]|nr:peptide chain release factor N(5)-glutamine methyltransferase [Brumimicrobium salinarum]
MNTVGQMLLKFNTELNDDFSNREKKQIGKLFMMDYMSYDGSELILNKNEQVPENIKNRVSTVITEINNGTPVQYVLGASHFYGLEIKSDPRALIPRPETEELVDWILKKWKDTNINILDVGTGSGCIALALKANLENSRVTGVDVIQHALDLANENAENLNLDVSFKFANAMNLSSFSSKKWDVIVSNPPYIPIEEETEMQDNVIQHEPKTALFVPNENPLIFYKAIGIYAKNHLNDGGSLYFEVHENLAQLVKSTLQKLGFSKIEVKKDLQDKERMIHAQL